jgi:hypothetical protein
MTQRGKACAPPPEKANPSDDLLAISESIYRDDKPELQPTEGLKRFTESPIGPSTVLWSQEQLDMLQWFTAGRKA